MHVEIDRYSCQHSYTCSGNARSSENKNRKIQSKKMEKK